MNIDFKKFSKTFLIFASPFIFLVLSYFIFDPFHVLYGYESYGSNFLKTYNRNRVSTEVFRRHAESANYNSFIFGSSRSSAFLTQSFKKHLPANAIPFHFDAFNDNISGFAGKLKYIKQHGNKIENVLMIVDENTFSEKFEISESLVHLKDPRWSGDNPLDYHMKFFKSFFKKQYFVSYFDLKIFKTYRPYMSDFFNYEYYYTDIDNDFLFTGYVRLIQADSVKYYQGKEFINRELNPPVRERFVQNHHLKYLRDIQEIFKKENTQYKVVICPTFDRKKYNPLDLQILKVYFGAKNVYDYSGKNEITNDIRNYYEGSHFKPIVGNQIMNEIYQ